MKYLLTILLTVLTVASGRAQQPLPKIYHTAEDVSLFNEYCLKFQYMRELPMNELVVETGKYFLGTPYVNFTLEVREPEELIVNLRELDCVTFVETVVALARCIKTGELDFDAYCRNLLALRYRDGVLYDFTSRLHYFSDWIANNEAMGLVGDRTGSLGGDAYPIRVNLMSTKPNNYRQLKANPEMVPVIREIEENIISRRTMAYIPREKADSIASGTGGGLIVGITTNWMMDITHCGFLIIEDGKPHFMHASSTAQEVVITEMTLQEYLESKRTMNGFMAVEVLAPGQSVVRENPSLLDRHPELKSRFFLYMPKKVLL
jgi:hypothetical protein